VSGAAAPDPKGAAKRAAWTAALLALVLVGAYAGSIRGGFLNYDDPWLIQNNPVLARPDLGALRTIWGDLTDEGRMSLGAEYLPVRDTVEWLEARVHGLDPHAMRALNLALYVGGALLFRAWLLAALGAGVAAEIAAWAFALHPAHVESVAWLAGRKDVLAFFFVGAALVAYAKEDRRARALAVPLVVLACLSKGVAVAAPLLLPLHDLLRKRRVDWPVVAGALAGALGVMAVHVSVGRTVHMTTGTLGGSRLAAAATMGPVFARYLAHSAWPAGLSIIQEAHPREATDLLAWLAYAPLVAWAVVGARLWSKDRRPAIALALFLVPMGPTSQILVSLQNVMADRYLLLPLLGPALVAGLLAERAVARDRRAIALPALALAGLFAVTVARAELFADSVKVFGDATEKTTLAVPPFHVGKALEARGDVAGAEAAYREAVGREPRSEAGRRAANSLAELCLKQGRFDEAMGLLARAVALFPDDPKVLGNLAEITARHGDAARARQLFELLLARFPAYEVGRRNFERHFPGSAPPAR
jgi:tetratricopeptide (TPR) repeat protein